MKWGTNLKAHFGGKVIVDEEDKNTNKSIQLENQQTVKPALEEPVKNDEEFQANSNAQEICQETKV